MKHKGGKSITVLYKHSTTADPALLVLPVTQGWLHRCSTLLLRTSSSPNTHFLVLWMSEKDQGLWKKDKSTTCAQDPHATIFSPQKPQHMICKTRHKTQKKWREIANTHHSHRSKWATKPEVHVSMAYSKHLHQCFRTYLKPEWPKLLAGTEASKSLKFQCT